MWCKSDGTCYRYRSVADEYFIPQTVSLLVAHYEKLELENQKTLWRAFSRAWLEGTDEMNSWGFRFYKGPDLEFSAMGARSKGEPWDLLSHSPIILPC